MGPSLVPSSTPCTPAAVDLSGPGLIRQTDFKVRSNSLAAESIIDDLADFDPLLRPSLNAQTSLETIQSVVHGSFEDTTAETPTNSHDLTPTLDANAASYVLLDKSLQLIPRSGSNYAKEAENLAEYVRSIAFNNENSLFLAPSVNYNTTKAESIKLVVTEDKTYVLFVFV